MKTKKIFLASLALAGMLGACTNDEIVEVKQNDALTERTQVNLTLDASGVKSRMTNGTGWNQNFTVNDVLGAVLVDAGYDVTDTYGVNWDIIDGHVGNNKWSYNDKTGKFETNGTTSIGAWVFYTKYNENMTTKRHGIEFDFPQIQDGAKDYEKIQNNNINFLVTPVLKIKGYEGQKLNFGLTTYSVFNRLRMPFNFSEVGAKLVQKIVVKATDADGNQVIFPAEYKVKNTNLPIADLRNELTMNSELSNVDKSITYKEVNWTTFAAVDYKPAVVSRDASKGYGYLVVDLDEEHTDKEGNGGLAVAADGKFSAVMLMPAGVYGSITFDIYTDKGIYTKTISDRNVYRDNVKVNTPQVSGSSLIFLRPATLTVLSDIEEKLIPVGKNAETLTEEAYIKIEANDKAINADLITKTADLIDFINGIQSTGSYDVNVLNQSAIGDPTNGVDDAVIPAHSTIINKEVMAALENKEKEVGDIQLVFKNAMMQVKGAKDETERLDIHDLTFEEGCTVTEGYVKATSEINVVASKSMIVDGGSNVQLALRDNDIFNRLQVNDGAKVTVTRQAKLKNVVNDGHLTFKAAVESNIVKNNETVIISEDGDLTVTTTLNNGFAAKLTVKNKLTVEDGTNEGDITNSGAINVKGNFINKAYISIEKDAKIHVNDEAQALLTNEKDAFIENNGILYTLVGYDNKIANMGEIWARTGSTTYITTNSKENEKNVATNDADQIMGTIRLEERNLDISVTTETQQGYILYNIAKTDLVEGVLTSVQDDKFNKVVLTEAAELSAEANAYVNFIETNSDLVLPKGARIQELTFTGNAQLKAEPTAVKNERAIVSSLTVNKDVFVKIPTTKAIYVFGMKTFIQNSSTDAEIHNEGEILVGGNLWTSLVDKTYVSGSGLISAGDGNSTALHWNENW